MPTQDNTAGPWAFARGKCRARAAILAAALAAEAALAALAAGRRAEPLIGTTTGRRGRWFWGFLQGANLSSLRSLLSSRIRLCYLGPEGTGCRIRLSRPGAPRSSPFVGGDPRTNKASSYLGQPKQYCAFAKAPALRAAKALDNTTRKTIGWPI